ncbi:DNA repair protein RAD4-like isoform X1 [Coffea arabica]|uniref:DNA repair protein RAD4-like isoform X1 n=1 Tax=Coffea arabica TaxID=13443 RepID=A0ABM4V7A8_COFAR
MRTRSKSRQTQQPNVEEGSTKYPGNEGKRSSVSEKFDDSGTLTNISRHAVGRLLKRVKSCGSRGLSKEDDGYLRPCDSTGMLESESEKNSKLCFNRTDRVEDGYFSGNVITNTPSESGARDGLDESEWEEGSLPTEALTKSNEEQTIGGVTVEFDVTPDSVKKKSIRRATAEEKELSELVHKVNLLCLLGRGRSFDSACNDPLIQASLLSLLPARLLKITEVPKLTAKALAPLFDWFHNNFHVRGPGSTEKPPHLALASTLEAQEGTAEEVAALSVALFRALNLTVRFVAILDVVSLKPEVDRPECNSQVTGKVGGGIFNSSTLMVSGSGHQSVSPPLTTPASDEKDDGCLTSAGGKSRVKARKVLENSFESKDMSGVNLKARMAEPSTSKCQDADSHACLAAKSDRPKRKGDLEFEMQLEMALSATAIENSKAIMNSDLVDVCGTNSKQFPPAKKMKVVGAEGSSVSPHGMSTAIGSRKVGAPLYWAEVYCSGENLTGKWVHVDAVNAIIDGEQKVEVAVAACRKSLRYVVAFAGNGAKDVTRRYCTRWYKIESQRINAIWWDAVLAPLKDLESRATGGVVHSHQEASTTEKIGTLEGADNQIKDCLPDSFLMNGKSKKENCEDYSVQKSVNNSFSATRSSLEDMELETRALTEPLPTNQQAYRNHQLYAIERWLNKYQILHPKGPILGFCSGHPVYPRTCVQTLHTKERWMREGLQVKADELPAKTLKRSPKQSKEQAGEDDEIGEGDHLALYGKWQTEPLCLPHAVGGIVPKVKMLSSGRGLIQSSYLNERGQVDVWSEKCLPPGTIHLRLPRVTLVAKRLEIDFAPAMVGFEFRNGRSVPVFEGIVVCAEFKDAILEAYEEEEERRVAEEKRRNEAQALSRWYQLLSSIITRQRLNNCYGNGTSQEASVGIQKPDDTLSAEAGCKEDSRKSGGCHQDKLKDNQPTSPQSVPTEDHEHVFLLDDEMFDEESSTRTKRCKCGFSIQFEEL